MLLYFFKLYYIYNFKGTVIFRKSTYPYNRHSFSITLTYPNLRSSNLTKSIGLKCISRNVYIRKMCCYVTFVAQNGFIET